MLDCGVYDGIHCLMEKEMAHNRAALSIDPSLSFAVLIVFIFFVTVAIVLVFALYTTESYTTQFYILVLYITLQPSGRNLKPFCECRLHLP